MCEKKPWILSDETTSCAAIRIGDSDAAHGAHARAARRRVPYGSARHHNVGRRVYRVRNVARVFHDFLSETCVARVRHRHPVLCYDRVIYTWRGSAAFSPQLEPFPKMGEYKYQRKAVSERRLSHRLFRSIFAALPSLFLSLFLCLLCRRTWRLTTRRLGKRKRTRE